MYSQTLPAAYRGFTLRRQRLTGPHVVVGAQLREPAPLEGVGHRLRGLAGGPPAARQATRGYPAASLVSARRAELGDDGRWSVALTGCPACLVCCPLHKPCVQRSSLPRASRFAPFLAQNQHPGRDSCRPDRSRQPTKPPGTHCPSRVINGRREVAHRRACRRGAFRSPSRLARRFAVSPPVKPPTGWLAHRHSPTVRVGTCTCTSVAERLAKFQSGSIPASLRTSQTRPNQGQ